MKMLNLFSFFSVLLLLTSCGENENRTAETEDTAATQQEFQDPEEARTAWIDAWNSNDVERIRNHAASDAVLVLNGREVPADSIAAFYQDAGSVMKDLEMNSLKKGSTDNMAYDTGTFTHTYSSDTTASYRGTYTFIWERTDDENEWKVKAMNISDGRDENMPE